MGWSSRSLGETIDDASVRAIADAVNANGMRPAGYSFINIDDGWQGERWGQGDIRPNVRFPDMRALAAYVHSQGLFIGIYSSPSPKTCLGYEGSYGHEEQDAHDLRRMEYGFHPVFGLCAGDKLHDSEASLPRRLFEDGRGSATHRTAHCLQRRRFRQIRDMEMGRANRREFMANFRRSASAWRSSRDRATGTIPDRSQSAAGRRMKPRYACK